MSLTRRRGLGLYPGEGLGFHFDMLWLKSAIISQINVCRTYPADNQPALEMLESRTLNEMIMSRTVVVFLVGSFLQAGEFWGSRIPTNLA